MDENRIRELITEELHLRGINGGSLKELRADFYWIRHRRLGEQTLKNWITRAGVTLIVGGLAAALLAGAASYLQ